MQITELVHHKRRASFARRWRELCAKSALLDYEKAALAHEIRVEFPIGASGDFQFRRWVMGVFEIAAPTASKLVRAAHAYRRFTQKEWFMLGGWRTVSMVVSLSQRDAVRLVAAVKTKAREIRRDLTYHQVRTLSFVLGIKSANTGRPSRTETEERLGYLRAWVKRLYRDFNGLPKKPEHVERALGETKLARISKLAGAG